MTPGETPNGEPEAPERTAGPSTHRREGPAYVDWPTPTVDELVWKNVRGATIIGCSVVLGISWGVHELLWGTGPPHRLAGLAATSAAMLLAASYLLRSFSTVTRNQWWFRTRPRRITRLVLTYTWMAFFFVVLVAGIVAWIW